MSGRGLRSRASSSSDPPQRRRVTVTGSPGVTAMQLAANGRPIRAATRAITSLPRSVPAAKTAVGSRWAIAAASASGANGWNASIAIDCGSPN